MPESAAQPAREAARRQAVDTLRIAASIAAYSAERIGNGLSPQEATRATADAARELELIVGQLRRLTRRNLAPAERRALAVQLVAEGLTQRQAAAQIGVSPRRAWDYLHGR